jgi:hypothetical protein
MIIKGKILDAKDARERDLRAKSEVKRFNAREKRMRTEV